MTEDNKNKIRFLKTLNKPWFISIIIFIFLSILIYTSAKIHDKISEGGGFGAGYLQEWTATYVVDYYQQHREFPKNWADMKQYHIRPDCPFEWDSFAENIIIEFEQLDEYLSFLDTDSYPNLIYSKNTLFKFSEEYNSNKIVTDYLKSIKSEIPNLVRVIKIDLIEVNESDNSFIYKEAEIIELTSKTGVKWKEKLFFVESLMKKHGAKVIAIEYLIKGKQKFLNISFNFPHYDDLEINTHKFMAFLNSFAYENSKKENGYNSFWDGFISKPPLSCAKTYKVFSADDVDPNLHVLELPLVE